MYDYLIVGSGLYGSTLARLLKEKGKKVIVVEKRNHIAGNIYTEKIDNINVHVYGAHIFHTSNKEVWDFVNRFAKFNNYINSPIANYHGELYHLPFNMYTFEKVFKTSDPKEAERLISEEIKTVYKKNPKNLKEQALNLVGPTLYKLLIEGYTEKQWGRKCEELDPSIIKRIPIRYTFDNNYFNDIYQGIPIGGYTQLIEKLLDGIEVKLNFDYLKRKDEIPCKKVIFTGQIDEFFDYCFGELEYRSLKFEVEKINKESYQGFAVSNYTDKETPYTRIIEHKYFENDISPVTIISKEYPKTWRKGDEAYYPINNERNKALYEKYLNKSEEYPNVMFKGRLGLYKYLDMDDVIALCLEDIKTLD